MKKHIRKKFDADDYENNDLAFSYFERDVINYNNLNGTSYFPVLKYEDYNIDVAVYYNKNDYLDNKEPIFYIELEIKTKDAANWEKNNYPYSDIHFLYRKDHLIIQDALPFWVCYNYDGTDSAIIPIENVSAYPIALNGSKYGDYIHIIPTEALVFGNENLLKYIELYVNSQIDNEIELKDKYNLVNKYFRNRHLYKFVKSSHEKLIDYMRRNLPIKGINEFI